MDGQEKQMPTNLVATDEKRPRRIEPKRKTAERHGVCVKTIDRWVEREILDPPIRINGRDYFDADCKPKT
jgi:hypothetical protein